MCRKVGPVKDFPSEVVRVSDDTVSAVTSVSRRTFWVTLRWGAYEAPWTP